MGLAPRPDGPGALPPAQRERLGGRDGLAVDQLHPRPLRRGLGGAARDIEDGSIGAGETPARAVARAIAATGRPRVGPRTARAMRRYAVRSVAGRTDGWEVEHYFPERQRVLRHLLLAGPDAQVC